MKVLFFTLSFLFPIFLYAEDKPTRVTLNWEEFVKIFSSENLDLKAEGEIVKERESNAKGLGLPAPTLGIMRSRTSTGAEATGVEISQYFPNPLKLIADKKSRMREAVASGLQYQVKENELLALAKTSYVTIWATQERLILLKEKKKALEEHVNLTRSGVRSNSSASIHLLKVENDLDLVESDILAAQQTLAENRMLTAVILGENYENFKPLVAAPPEPSLPESKNISEIPAIIASTKELEAFESRETLAKAAWIPDLTLKYFQSSTFGSTPSTQESSAAATLSISIPFLYFWEPNREVEKAKAALQEKHYRLEKRKLELGARVDFLRERAQTIKSRMQIIEKKVLPRAYKRLQLVHHLAPRDLETLEYHRETVESVPNLKLDLLDLRISFEFTVAELGQLAPLRKVESK